MLRLEVQDLGNKSWCLVLELGAMIILRLEGLWGKDKCGRDVNCCDQRADRDHLKMCVYHVLHALLTV